MPTRLATNAKGKYNRKIPIGIYDKSILCEKCERTFSDWENYGYNLFVRNWEKFNRKHHNGKIEVYELKNFDYVKLKLFILSILWKASVSSHDMFSWVNLGPHAALLRTMILEKDPGNNDDFGVMFQAFDKTKIGILNPTRSRLCNLNFYKVYLSHIIAWIKVDSQPFPDSENPLILQRERPLIIGNKSFTNSQEIRIMLGLINK